MSTKLSSLTQRARRDSGNKFTSLMHLMTEEYLLECFGELKSGKAPGIDKITVEEYEENLVENIKGIVRRLKAKQYRPQPVRRAYIPKTDGTKRGLGIPTTEDKIVQMGIKKILEAIYEGDFVEVSYGFRPKRSCHDALSAVNEIIMTKPVSHVVDMDIEKFFDTVNHKWMGKCLRQKVSDPNVLQLIGKFLRTGIMEEGKYIEMDKGTPQGGIISPMLANIYLHYILDLWMEKVIKKQMRGYVQHIRYADDFVVFFQRGDEAEAYGKKLRQRLDKFGLKIAEEKARTGRFGRYEWYESQRDGRKLATFDFLGLTHYCARSRKGKFRLGRKTAKVKYWQKVKAMNQWMREVRNMVELREWWKVLRQKLSGHYRYYGIGGNSPSLEAFYQEAIKIAYKWVNRRSQRRSYNWTQFSRFLKYNPLPKPKIYHPYPVTVRGKYY